MDEITATPTLSNDSKKYLPAFSLTNYQDMPFSGVAICLMLYCFMLILFPVEPAGDLLRHMTSHLYHYDYRQMYPASPGVPAWNMYYLFDLVVGQLHVSLGQPFDFITLQVSATLLFAGATYWLLKDATSNNLRLVLMMGTLSYCSGRINLASPTTFESGLFLLAMAASNDKRIRWWFHLALGIIMSSFYYLFALYLIPLAFLRRIYAIPLIGGVLGWYMYAGGDYFRVLFEMFTSNTHSELFSLQDAPAVFILLSCSVIIIPALIFWSKNTRQLLATAFFFLSSQARYLEIIVPSLVSYAKHWEIKLSQTVVVLIAATLITQRPNFSKEESFLVLKDAIPANSKVLCLGNGSVAKTVYGNNGVKLSPCMEMCWDTKETVDAVTSAQKSGEFNPNVLKFYPYDYLVENNLREIPNGLELVKVAGNYRIWKIPPAMRPFIENEL